MPICPRCGKSMSSEQALMYHLNKRNKCCTWKCIHCNDIFNTKFQLQLHEMQCPKCVSVNDSIDVEFLLNLFNNLQMCVLKVDENNIIRNANPYAKHKLPHVTGLKLEDIHKYAKNINQNKDIVTCECI